MVIGHSMASQALRLYRAILKKGRQLQYTDKTYFKKAVRHEFEKGRETITSSAKQFQLEKAKHFLTSGLGGLV